MPDPIRFAAAPTASVAQFLGFLEGLTRSGGLSSWADQVFQPELIAYLDETPAGEQRTVSRIVPVAPISALMPSAPAGSGIDAHLTVRLVQRETVPASGTPMTPEYVPAVFAPHHYEIDLVTAPSPTNAYAPEAIPPIYSAVIAQLGLASTWPKDSGNGVAPAVEIMFEGWDGKWYMVTVDSPSMIYGVAGELQ
jgi:hypothetical protein